MIHDNGDISLSCFSMARITATGCLESLLLCFIMNVIKTCHQNNHQIPPLCKENTENAIRNTSNKEKCQNKAGDRRELGMT
jgi:hypothetical protein